MEIHSRHYKPVLNQTTARQVQFGGLSGLVSGMVGAIDSNRLAELVTTDGIGMILPRTAMALNMRGPDDARETFFREMSGLIGNIFLSGATSWLIVSALGNRVNFHNPHGIPAKAWISAENLQAFQTLYQNGLSGAQNIKDARKAFIHSFLEGLESTDRQLSVESRVASLKKLSAYPDIQEKMLKSTLSTVWGPYENAQPLVNHYKKLLSQKSSEKLLAAHLLDHGWGKLSKSSRDKLYDYFAEKKGDFKSGLKGTNPYDKMAVERIKKNRLASHLDSGTGRNNQAQYRKLFNQERLDFSLSDLRNEAKAFKKAIDSEALAKGLTSTVYLKSGQEVLTDAQNRGSLMTEMKFFLEQFVDRATYAVTHDLKTGRPLGKPALWENQKQEIENKLFGITTQKGFFKKIMPQLEDGLVSAALKSKNAYTWLPLGITFMALGGFVFYNNYITMKKHGGKVFFPGEGLPPIEGARPVGSFVSDPVTRPVNALDQKLYRNFGNFPNYPQFRNPNGGIIA